MSEASETARAIAAIAPKLPPATRYELRRQLSHLIAAPSPQELRAGRLGLLVQLIDASGGEKVTPAQYDAARDDPGFVGEDWPSRAQLHDAYGDFAAARSAAMALARASRPGGISYRKPDRRKGDFTRQDIVNAIQRARGELGTWPNTTTYPEWARLARRAARHHGQAEPRVPSLSVIASRFGNWSAALEHAKRSSTA